MSEERVELRYLPGGPASVSDAVAALHAEGLEPRAWGNGPGAQYDWHRHPAAKVLFCVRGAIVFRTRHRDVALRAGDRLELAAGVDHAATVGADGVECVEAYRPSGTPQRAPVSEG